ncbi:NAD-dependent protein deacetylase sirtuin-2 [Gryganskiella cystojenkinii]|nr:NAD-dependent protein deacetylase sirtuin-2 [Gryganskiella cystojenkinii]
MSAPTTSVRIPIKSRPLKAQPEPEPRIKIIKDGTIDSIADVINNGQAKKIIVMTGAGISTAAGIKDFRSPGTGLYDDLQKYNLPFPEAVFDLAFFKNSPQPFYSLAKELYPGRYRPTLTHYLLPLLAKRKILLRSYTQNIDSLERISGLDEDLLVEAHGSFATSKCVLCEMTSDPEWAKSHILNSEIPYCKRCGGLVKPSITFFGESLPSKFSKMADNDFEECDLLIVLGTSLKVEPFNRLIGKVSPRCPRLLINREKAGQELHSGFDFDDKQKYTVQRDALFLGNCDEGVRKLASLCGWETELQAMYDEGHLQLKLSEEQEQLKPLPSIHNHDQDNEDEQDDLQLDEDTEESSALQSSTSTDTSSLDDITLRFGQYTLSSQTDDAKPSSKTTTSTSSDVTFESGEKESTPPPSASVKVAEPDTPLPARNSENAGSDTQIGQTAGPKKSTESVTGEDQEGTKTQSNVSSPVPERSLSLQETPVKLDSPTSQDQSDFPPVLSPNSSPGSPSPSIIEQLTMKKSSEQVDQPTDQQIAEGPSEPHSQQEALVAGPAATAAVEKSCGSEQATAAVPAKQEKLETNNHHNNNNNNNNNNNSNSNNNNSNNDKTTSRSVMSGAHSVPPYILTPASSLSEVSSGSDSSQFLPTLTAPGPGPRQPFSACVPVTTMWTNSPLTEVSHTFHSSSSNSHHSSSGGVHSSNLIDDAGVGGDDDNTHDHQVNFSSSGEGSHSIHGLVGGGGGGGGPNGGSTNHFAWRKRRRDLLDHHHHLQFQHGYSGTGGLKGGAELRHSRGHGTLTPHYLTSGRVTKRRRVM